MEVLAIIPARSGSKSIQHKNIREFNGQPLLAHSIQHALLTKLINRVIVTTNSKEYGEVAIKAGAQVPFLRPDNISQDLSSDLDVFIHALTWLKENENYIPDIIVQLRPTTPIRKISDIQNCIEIIINDDSLDSVRSIAKSTVSPFKMWQRNDEGLINQILTSSEIPESHSMPRQLLPITYLQNASVDVIKYSTIMDKKSMVGDKCFGYIMDNDFDIDHEHEWTYAESVSKLNSNTDPKTFCFDIDGVLASLVPNNDYTLSEPILKNIRLVNTLFMAKNKIILYTARGSKTGIDWEDMTKKQLLKWGVNYHKLDIGKKPAADFYIDDRFIEIEFLRKNIKTK